MALPQRKADGTLARKLLVGFGDTTSGYIDRAGTSDACCCNTFQWCLLKPCSTDPPYWWDCGTKIYNSSFDSGCRWVSLDKLKQFMADSGHPVYLDFVLYDSVSEACYTLPVVLPQGTNGRAFPPNGGFDATDFVTLLGTTAQCCDHSDVCGGLNCDDCALDPDGCDQDPPVDPPPDPGPSDCTDCGEDATCTHCNDCQPGYGIRVTLSGMTNCTCIGPCGNGPSYAYARLKDGEDFNGTYDLFFKPDLCEWRYDTAKTLLTGTPGDPSLCGTENTTSFSIHLKRLDAATWVLAIYKNAPDPTDPRDEDATSDIDQARAFSGSSITASKQCMTIPAMFNTLGCGCTATLTSDGRFNICTGGQANFTILCA